MRLDKERLLFYASLAGLGLLALAFFLHALIPPFIPCVGWLPCLPEMERSASYFAYLCVSVTALLLGISVPRLLNFYWKFDEESAQYIEMHGDEFEQMINGALDNGKAVMVTLKSGKVYVGLVASSFTPTREQRTIRLVPLRSGYREPDKHRVNFTTYYSEVIDKVKEDLADIEGAKGTNTAALEVLTEQLSEAKVARDEAYKLLEPHGQNNAALATRRVDDLSQKLIELKGQIARQDEEMSQLRSWIKDFGVVVPIDDITSCSLYRADFHEKYFPHTDLEDQPVQAARVAETQ